MESNCTWMLASLHTVVSPWVSAAVHAPAFVTPHHSSCDCIRSQSHHSHKASAIHLQFWLQSGSHSLPNHLQKCIHSMRIWCTYCMHSRCEHSQAKFDAHWMRFTVVVCTGLKLMLGVTDATKTWGSSREKPNEWLVLWGITRCFPGNTGILYFAKYCMNILFYDLGLKHRWNGMLSTINA